MAISVPYEDADQVPGAKLMFCITVLTSVRSLCGLSQCTDTTVQYMLRTREKIVEIRAVANKPDGLLFHHIASFSLHTVTRGYTSYSI